MRLDLTKNILTYLGVEFIIRGFAEEPAPRGLEWTVDLFVDNLNSGQKVGNQRAVVRLEWLVPDDA